MRHPVSNIVKQIRNALHETIQAVSCSNGQALGFSGSFPGAVAPSCPLSTVTMVAIRTLEFVAVVFITLGLLLLLRRLRIINSLKRGSGGGRDPWERHLQRPIIVWPGVHGVRILGAYRSVESGQRAYSSSESGKAVELK